MIYFASMTGNVRRFVAKTGLPAEEIRAETVATEPYILITYTFGFGEVPNLVKLFLSKNADLMRAVAVSGNRNWGEHFGGAGDVIARQYNVPLLHKFELSGTQEDVEIFVRKAGRFCDISS